MLRSSRFYHIGRVHFRITASYVRLMADSRLKNNARFHLNNCERCFIIILKILRYGSPDLFSRNSALRLPQSYEDD